MKTLTLLSVLFIATPAFAGEATPLFDGKTTAGWTDSNGDSPKWVVKDGTLSGKKKSGYLWTAERYGDFRLTLEFKTEGNSGVFFRCDNPKNPVQTGIEIQVHKPGGPNKHSVGAIYDLVAPSKNAGVEGWNKLEITAKGKDIHIVLNGEAICSMDLDQWTEPRKNPDGSKNKFKTALKDFKREGHIGFQDHGANVAYRNITIEEL